MIGDEALWRIDFLFDLADGHRIELLQCQRSDRRLFDAYSCLINEKPEVLHSVQRFSFPDLIAHYRKLFPSNGFTTHHLCISHEMRIKINKKENQRLAPDDAELLTVKGSQTARCAAQSMLIWPGIKLLGCLGRSRKGVRNGCIYTVK